MTSIVNDRADWLLDAVATATQNRRFLRGDAEYDAVAGEAILLNGAKAIRVALEADAAEVTPSMIAAARATGPDLDDRVFTLIYQAMRLAAIADSRRMAETGTSSVRSTTSGGVQAIAQKS
jgi:hypothetical protein